MVMTPGKSRLVLRTIFVYVGLLILSIGITLFFVNWLLPNLPESWQGNFYRSLSIVGGAIVVFSAIAESTGYSLKYILSPDKKIENSEKISIERKSRIRKLLLERVRNIWIDGVLKSSLHGRAMLELGKAVKEEKVKHPWNAILKSFDALPDKVNVDIKTIETFKSNNRALLILGEPGSGKTTTLLELAQIALGEAQEDLLAPVPIIFQLSTWSQHKKNILEWVIDELRRQYGVNRIMAREWMENESLFLLFDGLDEVRTDYRELCVKRINNFRSEYGMTELVVSCRTTDYEDLPIKLNLDGAIILQELTEQQVTEYLQGIDSELIAARRTLELDSEFKGLARSPLFLNVMVLAYRGLSIQELHALNENETRRSHIWRHYIERMYNRRACSVNYSLGEINHWLGWLANKMTQLSYPIFFERALSDEWLETPFQGFISNFLTSISSFSILGCLLGTISGFAFSSYSSWMPFYGFIFGLIIGMSYGFLMGIIAGAGGVLDLFRRSRDSQRIREPKNNISQQDDHFHAYQKPSLQDLIEKEQNNLLDQSVSWESVKRACLIWFIVWGVCGLGTILNIFPRVVFTTSTVIGLVVGLLFLELNQMRIVAQFILQIILVSSGCIPRNYSDFLGCSSERIYLRKVGDGYMFIHPLLSKYFSDQFKASG